MPRRSSHREERLRIVPQPVWGDARSRQLIARVALNREILLQAAASAPGCLEIGSGGLSSNSSAPEFVDISLR
jgi:hypothetical protein